MSLSLPSEVLHTRVAWIDTARGYGIVLVVVAHVLRGLVTSGILMPTQAFRFEDSWIYSFHMPLFFFLAGLLLSTSAQRGMAGLAADKFRTIAYPYLVWSALTVILKAMLGAVVNHPRGLSSLPSILVVPIEQFWFLYALFVLTMLVGCLLSIGARPWLVLALAIAAYPAILPISATGWAPLDDARHCAIFLSIGVLAHASALSPARIRRGAAAAVSAAGFLCVAFFVALPVFPGRELAAPIIALLGILATTMLAVATSGARIGVVIQYLGRHSLEIFVVHTMAAAGARILLQRAMHVDDPVVHALLGIFAGIAAPLGLALVLQRLGVDWAFTLPKRAMPFHRAQTIAQSGE